MNPAPRILFLGDSLAATTGFGNVIRHLALHCVDLGWDVAQLAGLDVPPFCDTAPFHQVGVTPYFPSGQDVMGIYMLPKVLEHFKPDVIFLMCDPGGAEAWFATSLEHTTIPVVLYSPIEGAPIRLNYTTGFRLARKAFTVTRFASQKLKQQHDLDVPFVYHGVDHAVFRPRRDPVSSDTPSMRDQTRTMLDWTEKYVVMYVARNNGRKGHDRLIKALAQLRYEGKADSLLLYLHCKAFDSFNLQGWDLRELAGWYGVADIVQFSPQERAIHGESSPTLAMRYNAADLYVSASGVEGFGLPTLEAMACGLPVIIPDDEGVQMEVAGDASMATLAPVDWETWHTGAQIAKISPGTFAAAIEYAQQHPEVAQLAAARGIQRAQDFRWDVMCRTLVQACYTVMENKSVDY